MAVGVGARCVAGKEVSRRSCLGGCVRFVDLGFRGRKVVIVD